MDGVLINSEPLWKIAEAKAFNAVGLNIGVQEMEQTVGLRIDEVVSFWKSKYPFTSKSESEVVDDIVDRMVDLIKEQGEPLPGVKEALLFMQKQKLKIGLATSSYTVLINVVLEKLDIKDYFELCLSAQDVEFGKPHPQVYIETAKKLNVQPERCLVIEDSFNGMLAGLSAKMKVAVIPEKSHTSNEKLKLSHYYFNSLTELISYFSNNKVC